MKRAASVFLALLTLLLIDAPALADTFVNAGNYDSELYIGGLEQKDSGAPAMNTFWVTQKDTFVWQYDVTLNSWDVHSSPYIWFGPRQQFYTGNLHNEGYQVRYSKTQVGFYITGGTTALASTNLTLNAGGNLTHNLTITNGTGVTLDLDNQAGGEILAFTDTGSGAYTDGYALLLGATQSVDVTWNGVCGYTSVCASTSMIAPSTVGVAAKVSIPSCVGLDMCNLTGDPCRQPGGTMAAVYDTQQPNSYHFDFTMTPVSTTFEAWLGFRAKDKFNQYELCMQVNGSSSLLYLILLNGGTALGCTDVPPTGPTGTKLCQSSSGGITYGITSTNPAKLRITMTLSGTNATAIKVTDLRTGGVDLIGGSAGTCTDSTQSQAYLQWTLYVGSGERIKWNSVDACPTLAPPC